MRGEETALWANLEFYDIMFIAVGTIEDFLLFVATVGCLKSQAVSF